MAKVKSNKKQKEKRENKKEYKNNINKPAGFFTVNILTYLILFAIFLFSFYVRGIMPLGNAFRNGVTSFATDDAVFHMRLVENTINFFPYRIHFDAFTLYPYGADLHWGPLFDQMIAFFALIGGIITNNWNPSIAGMPSQSVIDTVGLFFPAVLGSLIVFPVFFIGKSIKDEKTGLIGAFIISILSGSFLDRSLLGFTDNHIAEVFYLTFMMMFFIIGIKKAETITFDHWLNRDWKTLKVPLIYSIFAGIFFGAYLLNWTNGVFFAVVFGIFVIIQYIIDHFRGKSTEYLGMMGIVAYIVAMIMVLPYVNFNGGFDSGHYSLMHLTVTGGGAVVFALLSLVSREMNKRGYKGYYYLAFILGILFIGLIFLKIFIPGFYNATMGNWDYMFKPHTGGPATIGEAFPPCGESITEKINCDTMLSFFGFNYFLSFIAFIILGYYILKKPRAEYTLIVVWSFFVLGIFFAQTRFGYYYAINIALLSAVVGSKILDLSGWKSFNSNDTIERLKKIRVQHVLSFVIVIAVIGFLPSDTSPYRYTMYRAEAGSLHSSAGSYEWHDALTWMRYNTPEPDLPYYSIYERPTPGQPYNYSKSDYGVMSWWDYGHMITYWGRRIPNANPFQAGIGGGDAHTPGASTFLVAPTENEANTVLEKLGINGKPGARYVISDAKMAYDIQPVYARWDMWDMYQTGFYSRVRTSQGEDTWPTLKYYNTMESKLHILDANGLHNYRLVHESTPNPNTEGGYVERGYKNIYNILTKENSLPVENSGFVKIFEYVKGAKITGSAPPDTTVTLTNTIKTNIGRTIQYKQVTSSNGTYEFIVPYCTLGPIPGETQFDTQPAGPYSVTADNISKNIDVGEKDVLEGRTITLNLV